MSLNYRTVLTLAGFAVITAAAVLFAGRDAAPTVHAQQDLMLERRLSQIEQRFFMLESRLGRLEQVSSPVTIQPPQQAPASEAEMAALRSQVDVLRIRVAELECALSRVDERTLTPAAREARRKALGAASDPCRENASEPLRLRSFQ